MESISKPIWPNTPVYKGSHSRNKSFRLKKEVYVLVESYLGRIIIRGDQGKFGVFDTSTIIPFK